MVAGTPAPFFRSLQKLPFSTAILVHTVLGEIRRKRENEIARERA